MGQINLLDCILQIHNVDDLPIGGVRWTGEDGSIIGTFTTGEPHNKGLYLWPAKLPILSAEHFIHADKSNQIKSNRLLA